jgi:hypothetical protein
VTWCLADVADCTLYDPESFEESLDWVRGSLRVVAHRSQVSKDGMRERSTTAGRLLRSRSKTHLKPPCSALAPPVETPLLAPAIPPP